MDLPPFETEVFKVIEWCVGKEKGKTTEEITEKVFRGQEITCHTKNSSRYRDICVLPLNKVRTAISNIRKKLEIPIYNNSFEAVFMDLETGTKQRGIKRLWYIPDTIEEITDVRDRTFKKNVKGNRREIARLNNWQIEVEQKGKERAVQELMVRIKSGQPGVSP